MTDASSAIPRGWLRGSGRAASVPNSLPDIRSRDQAAALGAASGGPITHPMMA
jgi:hypothetical protein